MSGYDSIAGEWFTRPADRYWPAVIALAIATVLVTWSLNARSGAEVIGRLPMHRMDLCACAITVVYQLRGVAGFALMAKALGRTPVFCAWSSGRSVCSTCPARGGHGRARNGTTTARRRSTQRRPKPPPRRGLS